MSPAPEGTCTVSQNVPSGLKSLYWNSLSNSFCSYSNLASADLCQTIATIFAYDMYDTRDLCCQGMCKICSDDLTMKYDKVKFTSLWKCALQWHHNECDGISNHQRLDCLLNRLFSRRLKKPSNVRVTGFCEGNSAVAGEFAAQRASNAEDVPFDDVIMEWKSSDEMGPQDIKATN